MSALLSGLDIIITRAVHQSENLRKAVLQHAGHPVLFPSLEISVLNNSELQMMLGNINDKHLLIFTSQNAVDVVAPRLPLNLKPAIGAIGPRTADALVNHKIPVDILPTEKFDSEHLLALPFFEDIRDKKIVIFGGKGGRLFLEDELKRKGASVSKIAVYQRECPSVNRETMEHLVSLPRPLLISTSCESLQNVFKIVSSFQQQQWLFSIPVLIISQRMREEALHKGFREEMLILSADPTEPAILERIIKWYANQSPK
ncbi:MAG: uroporphyrinogen-III synthase [Gammaproteobacteria bacterium]|nr:uroporphyrinogen-III synthase [Gammaproteobacteria bacterium]